MDRGGANISPGSHSSRTWLKISDRAALLGLAAALGVEVEDPLETMLGHRVIDPTTELHAPFDPAFLATVTGHIEAIIDEIGALTPGAFALPGGKVVRLGREGVKTDEVCAFDGTLAGLKRL